jgi:hypothetical protein
MDFDLFYATHIFWHNIREKKYDIHKIPPQNTFTKQHEKYS